MFRTLLAGLVLLLAFTLTAASVSATTITFDEPGAVAQFTNTYVGTHVMQYSAALPSFSIAGATLTPGGATPGSLVLRTTFDDRSPSPYAYDFIDGNVAQISSAGLDIAFASPVTGFAFGAALNATFANSRMLVDLLDASATSLGSFVLALDRTAVSIHGGTNSNSEGRFSAPNVDLISRVRLTNLGDGTSNGSQFNWVIDNVTYDAAPVPEPASGLLFAIGCVGVLVYRRHLARRSGGRL